MNTVGNVVRFPLEEVIRLVQHGQTYRQCSPSLGHMFGGAYRKDGQDLRMDGSRWPEMDDVDPTKVAPYVVLVKDQGVYLMSASTVLLCEDGKPLLAGDGRARRGEVVRPFMVYAEGMNPEIDPEFAEASDTVFGADDLVEPLPLKWLVMGVERSRAAGMNHLALHVNDDAVAICLPLSSA